MNNRVVITGLGAIAPLGHQIKSLWSNLENGVSGAGLITQFDTSQFKTQFACEVKDFNPEDYFDRKEARKMDRFCQFGMIAAEEAIRNAEINFDLMDKNRIGVIWSSGIGGFETFEQELEEYFRGNYVPKFNPFFITKIIANGLAGMISIKYGLHGINSCPVTACASSTQALIDGFNYIKWGKAEMIIVGGAEAPITRSSIGGFNAMKALSTNNDHYETACRPFDRTRDGFVVGEGAAGLVIERMDHALKRNAPIIAEVVGGGQHADAYHITGTHPEGIGAKLAISEAIKEAGILPEQVDYINAHATSTGLGDLSEIKAIQSVFGEAISKLNISATKSMTGHLLGAAGALEAVITALAVQKNVMPPTINTTECDEQLPEGLNVCLGNKVAKEVNYALSNSFGFGGHCAAVLLKKYNN